MVSFLRDRLQPRRVRVVSLMVLTIVVILQIVAFATADERRTIFGPTLGADFAGFYNAARILHDYPPAGLYDLGLQSAFYRDLFPAAAGESLPYAHAPFFALLLLPLALLPYSLAYALFLLTAPVVFASGLFVLRPALKHLDREQMRTAALLSLSYLPFLVENWVGGQVAALGFLWIALALRGALSGHPFAGGLALSVCFYKPTLLVLILPMLLIGKQFRILFGVMIGATALAGLSLLAVGVDGCAAYAKMLLNYGHGASAAEGFRTFKYVDVVSFFRLAMGNSVFADVFIAGVGCALVAITARTWWAYSQLNDDARRLAWAAVLTFTPVLNLYAPIYDTLLPVLGLLLTADVLARGGTAMPDAFRALLLLVYVVPWFSQALAQAVGFQPFTLVLVGAGLYQLQLVRTTPMQDSTCTPRQSAAPPRAVLAAQRAPNS